MIVPVRKVVTGDSLTSEQKRDLLAQTGMSGEKLARLAQKNKARFGDQATVAKIQNGLGLPPKECDGLWGPLTVAMIVRAQEGLQREPTGELDVELLMTLPTDRDDIPDSPAPPAHMAKSPASGDEGYYDFAYDPAVGPVWPAPNAQWERITSAPTWLAAMLRQLTGREVNSRGVPTYSRTPDDFITLDTYSLGIAHWWAATAPTDLLRPLCLRFPGDAKAAFGEKGYKLITDDPTGGALMAVTSVATGHRRYNPYTLGWLAAGWRSVAKDPLWIAAQIQLWMSDYIAKAMRIAVNVGIRWGALRPKDAGVVLAAVARMCNSGPAVAIKALETHWRGGHDTIIHSLERAFAAPRKRGGYDKAGEGPGRWRAIVASCRVDPGPRILGQSWDAALDQDLNWS